MQAFVGSKSGVGYGGFTVTEVVLTTDRRS